MKKGTLILRLFGYFSKEHALVGFTKASFIYLLHIFLLQESIIVGAAASRTITVAALREVKAYNFRNK